MKDVISVIMPVYNVAAYLPEAVESILNQDHELLEVILVDDGSRDESGAICDRYAAQDPRVKVIHQKNGGAAAAKNAGLRIATGEYLSFVDSDDYLEPSVYGYLLEILKQEQADVVQGAFRNVYRGRSEEFVIHAGRTEMDGLTYLSRFLTDWTCALLWNKLYRRELYDGVFFEEGHRIDDEYFTYQGFLKAKKVIVDDRIIYNYRRRASSAMHSPKAGEQLMFDRVDFMTKRRDIIAAHCPQLRREFDMGVMEALIYLSKHPDNTAASIALLKRELRRYLKDSRNTRPPRYLWRHMLKLYLTSPEKLLAQCDGEEAVDLSEYFA